MNLIEYVRSHLTEFVGIPSTPESDMGNILRAGTVKLAPSDLVKDAAAVVVGEPSRLRIITSEKGVLWYRASISGRSAHGSLPHLGDNAIYRMMRFLTQLEPYGRPKDALKDITVSLGTTQGGTKPNLVADLCIADLD